MIITLIKEKSDDRMTTVTTTIVNALISEGYDKMEVDIANGTIHLDTNRGAFIRRNK